MGYGGAYSWDWDRRELGLSYWKQELINEYKIDEIAEEKVDILVTHEAPFGKEISYKDEIPISIRQRELVLEIQNKVNPDLHVCGHHHTRENWQSGITDVHVLGRDDMEDESVLIMDI
jgi:Icc-related predicted phosphoesterase